MQSENPADQSPGKIEMLDSDNPSPKRGVKRKNLSNGDDIITINSDESSSCSESAIYVEESESEPEVDCEFWDADCKVVNVPVFTKPIQGVHHIQQLPKLNSSLLEGAFIGNFQNSWVSNSKIDVGNVELITQPFKTCVIKQFLDNDSYLYNIRQEFYEIDWNRRNLDLYEFYQSKDLKHIDFKYVNIKNMYEFLKNDVRKWVSELTGLELTHTSATCSFYSYTDYLLPHDDLQDDRMVAFVFYFTDGNTWDCKHGGALQLLRKHNSEDNFEVVREIFPSNNQFIFFQVSNESYHQVTEVTNKNNCRYSINGWFHSPKPVVFEKKDNKPPNIKMIKGKPMDIDLSMWINSAYLQKHVMQRIHLQIEEDSEISLKMYFKAESLQEVLTSLQSEEITWKRVGPPNRRSYEIIEEDNLPHIIERFLSLFQSNDMFNLLHHYTGLELTDKQASMHYELQRWTPGSYSLISDWHGKNELDVILYLGCLKGSSIVGGRTQYVAEDEEVQEAPITLEPEENSLNIVFRDMSRITKYFSKLSTCKCFYILVCSYTE